MIKRPELGIPDVLYAAKADIILTTLQTYHALCVGQWVGQRTSAASYWRVPFDAALKERLDEKQRDARPVDSMTAKECWLTTLSGSDLEVSPRSMLWFAEMIGTRKSQFDWVQALHRMQRYLDFMGICGSQFALPLSLFLSLPLFLPASLSHTKFDGTCDCLCLHSLALISWRSTCVTWTRWRRMCLLTCWPRWLTLGPLLLILKTASSSVETTNRWVFVCHWPFWRNMHEVRSQR